MRFLLASGYCRLRAERPDCDPDRWAGLAEHLAALFEAWLYLSLPI